MLATVRYLVPFGSYSEGARATVFLVNLSMSFVCCIQFSYGNPGKVRQTPYLRTV
ncbi:MAG: hypothetical protein AAFX80_06625 [Cyanobacteria bacterium J06639_18]